MSNFKDFLSRDRRLVILRFLAEEPDYRLNTSLLEDALNAVGHSVSRDLVDIEAKWLEDAGLVLVQELRSVKILELTRSGLDCAQGKKLVPGVKRPAPRGL